MPISADDGFCSQHLVVQSGHGGRSWIAGFALASSLGATGPVLVGTGVAALYFLPLMILLRKERTKRTAAEVVN